MKLTRELEDVELVEGIPLKVTKVGGELNSSMKGKIVEFLKENMDIFAWTYEDMLGIDYRVIEHHLNVNSMKKPV